MGGVRSGHSELADWCSRRAALLEQALSNAQLFGEDEVEVLNWLAEVAQRLAQVSVQGYQPRLLAEQHKHTLVRLWDVSHVQAVWPVWAACCWALTSRILKTLDQSLIHIRPVI